MFLVYVDTLPPAVHEIEVKTDSESVAATISFGNSRLRYSTGNAPVINILNPRDQEQNKSNNNSKTEPADEQNSGTPTAQSKDKQSFWERLFGIAPVRTRVEKVLNDEWKFENIRPRYIDWLVSEEGQEARQFFLMTSNARQYRKLVKEFGCGFEDRNGKIVDDNFDTLSEYGSEVIDKYNTLMNNRELIKKYFAGLYRDNRISTQSLIKIGNSVWFGPFGTSQFKVSAHYLSTRFKVPNHVIGPMLASVGDSYGLRKVLSRKTSPREYQELFDKITSKQIEDSGNAFAPALQLLVIGEEHKVPFPTLLTFVDNLKLRPGDYGPFSAVVFNLGVYRLASDIKCPTFAMFLRRELDEFGHDINQESARMFLHSFREFKNNNEALQMFLSADYPDVKAFLKNIGTPIPSTIWNMERMVYLTQILTPEKRAKISNIVRQLSEEVKVADIMFLAEISDNDEEVNLLLNREALVNAARDIKIDRIIERTHNDLVKELEREIDIANRNGLFRTVRRLMSLMREEKLAYTERVEPTKLTNIQLSRLIIFHRSLEMPGFMDTIGWNVSKDLQDERSEHGGYLGYDKDMAMVTMVPSRPGNNKEYRPDNLNRAPASLALFHNHAFKESFGDKYLGWLASMFGRRKEKATYAGPSGWVGAKRGDISAAAESELPSFIITKIGYPKDTKGATIKDQLLVNLDWVVVDRENGQALRSDRGVYAVPYYSEEQLGKIKYPSKKELKRRDKEEKDKCPPVYKQDTVMTPKTTSTP